MRGVFITFEGVDGSGKTTHAKRLYARLLEMGFDAVLTREPGGAPIAESIRALLLDPQNDMAAETEALLMAASRAEHVRKTLLPALNRGAVVISERYLDSTMAYQAYGRGLDIAALEAMNAFATGGLTPDITFLTTAPRSDTEARVARRDPDRLERESEAFRDHVADGFAALAARYPGRITVVECTASKDEVALDVFERAMPVIRRALGG